ncbi:MAG: hypothetical protein KDD64_17295 [Bdellovibrionales bacterium]|nr:hypothetical protein [Bdellovibrionales bacterium]
MFQLDSRSRGRQVAAEISSSSETDLHGATFGLPRLALHCENERRYFLPLHELKARIDLASLDFRIVTQSYFPRAVGNFILTFAQELDPSLSIPENLDITQVRLRQTEFSSGEFESFELVVKMKHQDHGATEKDELTFRVSERAYARLLLQACDGTVMKTRYFLPFSQAVGTSSPNPLPAFAEGLLLEIDVPIAQSLEGEVSDLSGLGYCIIDFEVGAPEVLEALRSKVLEVELLEAALDISEDSSEKLAKLRKPLSWKRLASKGFDDKARSALAKLIAEHRTRRVA